MPISKIKIEPQKLREIREKAGLSQSELARAAGISVNTVSRLERGQTVPTAATMQAILDVCGGQSPGSHTAEPQRDTSGSRQRFAEACAKAYGWTELRLIPDPGRRKSAVGVCILIGFGDDRYLCRLEEAGGVALFEGTLSRPMVQAVAFASGTAVDAAVKNLDEIE